MSWELPALAVLGVGLVAGFSWYERTRPPARIVAVVAALAALAVIGRIAFAPLPNVKPTSDIVLIAGFALGPAPGFAVGSISALVSNIFFVQGPWTPWQMAAWGGVGVAGAGFARLLRGREPKRLELALVCGAAGLAFGAIMDVYQWTFAAEQSLASYLLIAGSSLPYNLAHALGNVVFALLIGPTLIRSLRRIRARFDVHWDERAPRLAAGSVVSLALAAVLIAPAGGIAKQNDQRTGTGDPAADAIAYLIAAQNKDGGLGDDDGDRSNELFTGWAALAIASDGTNPASIAPSGKSITDYLEDKLERSAQTADLERTLLVIGASGLDEKDFGGVNVIKELLDDRRSDGSYAGLVNQTAFGILAQKAVGEDKGTKASAHWIADQQNEDGGFSFDEAGSESDVDVTGAVLQAINASGERDKGLEDDAVSFLRKAQNSDGGFGQRADDQSNAQSTAFAVQGLVASGETVSGFGRGDDPLEYLEDLQDKDGSIRYSRSSKQTPVWVTAQAALALRQKTFPLAGLTAPISEQEADDALKEQERLLDEAEDDARNSDTPSFGNTPGVSVGGSDFEAPKTPKSPKPQETPEALAPPGQTEAIPPGFSFGGIQPQPSEPSMLESAGSAAETATAVASDSGGGRAGGKGASAAVELPPSGKLIEAGAAASGAAGAAAVSGASAAIASAER